MDDLNKREAAVAGSFYPENADELKQIIDQCLQSKQGLQRNDVAPKAMIVPHAGIEFSGDIAAAGYVQLQSVARKIKRVVLLGGSSDNDNFSKILVSGASAFVTPLGEVPLDTVAIDLLKRHIKHIEVNDDIHGEEHCLEVQLPFLQSVLDDFKIIPLLVCSNTDYELFLPCLNFLWGGEETLIIISTNLSLNQKYEMAKTLDQFTDKAILQLQPNGLTQMHVRAEIAIQSLLYLGRLAKLSTSVFETKNSGDVTQSKDSVVGYGCYGFYSQETRFPLKLRQQLKGLARMSIEYGFRAGEPWQPSVDGYHSLLSGIGSCFITLFDAQGERRGSAGTIDSDVSLLEYICQSAYQAAFSDSLFSPLSLEEWSTIHLNIEVVTNVELIEADTEAQVLDQIHPFADGVVIRKGDQGVGFLPIDWYEFPDKQQFFAELKTRAGLDQQWDNRCEVYRYTTESW